MVTDNKNQDEDAVGLTAVLVSRLAATVEPDVLTEVLANRCWSENNEVAADWHAGQVEAQFQELRASAQGIERDRVFELVGCMSSTGERFGLALAAGNEVTLWSKVRETPAADRMAEAQREISQRALAELQGYYLLGTGHTMGSIVLRTLAF